MRVALYPGSFDPVTNGHIDLVHRGLDVFDRVVIGIAHNSNKQGLLTPDERAVLLKEIFFSESRVEVDIFDGLLIDYVHKREIRHVIRGLRAVADFEYEFQLALMNRRLRPEIDTVFLMTDQSHLYVSSSLVKEIARLGGDISAFVPANAQLALKAKLS